MRPGTPGFVGTRLTEGREARSVTVAALADELGVTRQTIYQYERDEQTPNPDAMEGITKLLRLPLAFFRRPVAEVRERSTTFFRSLKSAEKVARLRARRRLEWFADVVDYTAEDVELPEVSVPALGLPADPVAITNDQIERAADDVRSKWGLKSGPIENVAWLLENHGVAVGRIPLLADGLDGLSFWRGGRPYVVLASDKECCVRSRFDAAHELGHLVLHRHVSQQTMDDPALFKLIEGQAHRFAGAFLFPRESFAKEVDATSLDALRAVKETRRVSIYMMIMRAEALELIPADEKTTLIRNYVRRGWKGAEPLDDVLPVEVPALLRNAVELVVSERVRAREAFSADLALPERDIEESAGLESGYLSGRHTVSLKPPRLPGAVVPFDPRRQRRS